MSEVRDWDTVAANNNSAPPDGAPENTMLPSDVNDWMRETHAAIARWRLDLLDAMQGNVFGLAISNNGTDSDHDIDIAVGTTVGQGGSEVITLSSGLTKRIDAVWTAGTNQGGLDTGTVANDTLYGIWLIRDPTGPTVDVLFSTENISLAGVTLPSGYTQGQLIGAVATNGSANIHGFQQREDWFTYTEGTPPNVLANNSPSNTYTTVSILAPARSIAQISFHANVGGAPSDFYKYGATDSAAARNTNDINALWMTGDTSGNDVTNFNNVQMVPVDDSNLIDYFGERESASFTDFDIRIQGFLMQTRGKADA